MDYALTSDIYIPRTSALGKFDDCYTNWLQAWEKGNRAPHVAYLFGYGLSGKTAFIVHDVEDYLASAKEHIGNSQAGALLVHVDMDTFDHYQEWHWVMREIRDQLHAQNVRTPHLDCGLEAYWKRVLKAPFTDNSEDVYAAGIQTIDSVKTNAVTFIEEQLQKSPQEQPEWLKTAFRVLQIDLPLGVIADVARKIYDKIWLANEGTEELVKATPDSQLEDLLIPLLDMDLNFQGLVLTKGGIERICIALDGIGRAEGVTNADSYELELARSLSAFTILSSRSFYWDSNDRDVLDAEVPEGDAPKGMHIDLNESEPEEIDRLVEQVQEARGESDPLDDEVLRFIRGADNSGVRHCLPLGLAHLILSTYELGSSATSELKAYVGRHTRRGNVPMRTVTSDIARRVISIHLDAFSKENVPVLFVMAWFDSVGWHDMLRGIPDAALIGLTQPGFDRVSMFPYVLSEPGGRWRVHETVARFVRLECSPGMLEEVACSLRTSLEGSNGVKGTARQGILRALVRIRAVAFLRTFGPQVKDETMASLPDMTDDLFERNAAQGKAGGLTYVMKSDGSALGRWWAALGWNDASAMPAKPEDPRVGAFAELASAMLDANEGTRGGGSEHAFARAQALVEYTGRLYDCLRGPEVGPRDMALLARVYARALLRCGAIGSDVYRHLSKIGYHHDAFAMERKGVDILLDLHPTDSPVLLADSLNSIAVSSYRLKGYEYSLQFHALACCALDLAKKEGASTKARGKLLRNWAATLLGCVTDMDDDVAQRLAGTQILPSDCDELLKEAIALCDGAVAADGTRAWDAMISKAECYDRLGGMDNLQKALSEYSRVWDEIQEKHATESLSAARCRFQWSKTLLRLYENSGDRADLDAALAHAREALVIRFRAGEFKTDTAKSYAQVWAIEGMYPAESVPKPKAGQGYQLQRARDLFGEPKPEKVEERSLGDDERTQLDGLMAKAKQKLECGYRGFYRKELHSVE